MLLPGAGSAVGQHRVRVAAAVLPADVLGRVGVERGLVRAHVALLEQLLQATGATLALSAIGNSSATLARFDPAAEKYRWIVKAP